VYGHYLPFDFYPSGEAERRHVRRSAVRWSPAGATFVSVRAPRLRPAAPVHGRSLSRRLATLGPPVNLDLTDEQREIQRLARDFATAEVMPMAEELDREKRFPLEIVEELGKLGLMGVPYPQEHGGGGADTLSYALVVEELGRADQSVGIPSPPTPRSAPGRSTPSAPRAEAGVATAALLGPPARRLRTDRARGGLRRGGRPHHGAPGRRALDDRWRQAVSPTPEPTSPVA